VRTICCQEYRPTDAVAADHDFSSELSPLFTGFRCRPGFGCRTVAHFTPRVVPKPADQIVIEARRITESVTD
jgi:hypothetical protein